MALLARVSDEGEERQELGEHLNGVATSAERLLARKVFDFDLLSESELERVAYILGATHDFGKGTFYFQKYIRPDYNDPPDHKKRHASLSAYYAFYVLREEDFDREIAAIGWYVVQRHHGNLTSLFTEGGELHRKTDDSGHLRTLEDQLDSIREKTKPILQKCYQQLSNVDYVQSFLKAMNEGVVVGELTAYHNRPGHESDQERYYLVLLLYSVLLDADKMNSAGVSFEEWPSVGSDKITELDADAVQTYKKTELSIDTSLDEQRERASEYVTRSLETLEEDSRLLSLTMPTGSGKTLTGLDAALRLRETVDADRPARIIYSVPFLSIIDQNHEVFDDVLTAAEIDRDPSVLLRHDHTSAGYASDDDIEEINQEYYQNPDQSLLLTEGWNAELVTTTFVQFFETLVTNQKANARRFHKLANSIVLLDEIQAVPTKYWGVIREGIRILTEALNSYVILMTATNPLLFEPREEITELTDQGQVSKDLVMPDFEGIDRVVYRFDTDPITVDDLVDDLIEHTRTHPHKDVMVVLNTVGTTRRVYQSIAPAVDRETIYLSTRILPRDRQERIERIVESNDPKLVITTQLVEAGVDIDIDTIYRDFAPIDSLVQTAGRCNRENERECGTMHVVRLRDDRENAPREYYHQYVYDPVLTDATTSVIGKYPDTVTESQFTEDATERYFKRVKDRKTTDSEGIIPAMESLAGDKISISLIQQDYRTVPVFIERDNEATIAYERMQVIYTEYNGYARRGRLLKPKADFYSYIINVPISDNENDLATLPTTFIDNIRWVSEDQIGESDLHWYHPDTGFRIPGSSRTGWRPQSITKP